MSWERARTLQPLPRYRIYSKPRQYWEIAREALTRRWLKGDSCRELEQAIQKRQDVAHAICVAKARVGIYVAIRNLIRPGQKVVLSPYTISDVINMVSRGIPAENILKGIHLSVATRIVKLLSSVKAESPVLVTGGLSLNQGLVEAIGEKAPAGVEIRTHEHSAQAGALGAALWAGWRLARLEEDAAIRDPGLPASPLVTARPTSA